MIALIDGDILLYKFAFRGEDKFDFGDMQCNDIDFDLAKDEFKAFVAATTRTCNCNEFRLVFSNDFNFRYEVYPDYKSNRADSVKPALWHPLYDWSHQYYGDLCITEEGIEADDLQGIMSTKSPGEYVIASIDKDMKTIPGMLYNWNKMDKPRMVTESEANHFWMMQTLMGDQVDGYKGCPGIGPKRAEKILAPCTFDGGKTFDLEQMWNWVELTFVEKGYTMDDALVQARLARILRVGDWDEKKREPILWSPEKEFEEYEMED